METGIYETSDDYNIDEIRKIEKWLDKNIGTETERNEGGEEGKYYVMVFELNQREVYKIRQFEGYFRASKSA